MISMQTREDLAAAVVAKQAYLALTTSASTATAPGAEVTGSPYARQAATVTTGAVDGEQAQVATFGLPSAAGVTIVGWAAYSAVSGGTAIAWGNLPESQSLPASSTLQLTVTSTVTTS